MTSQPVSHSPAAALLPLFAALPPEVLCALLALLRLHGSRSAELSRQGYRGDPLLTVEVADPRVVAELVMRVQVLERRVRILEGDLKPGFVTIKQAAQRIPALTEDAMRAHIRHRGTNGLLEFRALIIKKGKRWLIDLDRLNKWLEKERQF